LSVPGLTDIFAIGDTALSNGWNGKPVPGLAPAAKQQGRYVASVIRVFLWMHCRWRPGSQERRRARMLWSGNSYELAQGRTAARKPRPDRADRHTASRRDSPVICPRQRDEEDSCPLLFG
jgi:hypothetical protein